jgi:hypothetical protein
MERRATKGIWRLEKKTLICSVLKFLDFTKSFEIHKNASDFVIKEVFMQCEHPNTFESKKLYGPQFWWVAHEKELYVVVCCFKTW